MEETDKQEGVVMIPATIYNTKQDIIIDTGAELSLISTKKYEELKKSEKEMCSASNNKMDKTQELPVQKITIIGANGKRNNSARKQIRMKVGCNNHLIQFTFIVCDHIEVDILVGCDNLKRYNAIIDLAKSTVKFENSEQTIAVPMKWSKNTDTTIEGMIRYQADTRDEEEHLWQEKLEEIQNFESNKMEISLNQKQLLINIYNKHRQVFSSKPGKVKDYQCQLNIREGAKFNRKSYPIPYKLRGQVQEEIEKMVDEGIIEPSTSEHTSPLVVVSKKDGTVRLCLDAREINKMIIADKTAPEETEEILKRFNGTLLFSSWDAVAGYWQVELHPDSRRYVAFMFNGRNYQFRRLPFGLINSVSLFIRALDTVLGREVLEFTTVYVDDLVIASKTWEEHCSKIDKILNRLEQWGVTLKLEKSKFLTRSMKFLGFIVSDEGRSVDTEKTQAIREFPTPKNLKQLQSFLGLCNYYRHFQANYSEVTKNFQHIISKKNKWTWGEHEDNCFQQVKDCFINCITLKHPNFDKPFYLNCDASDISLGSVLYQLNEKGQEEVIAFASRTISKVERNYTITEKEALGVVFAVAKFRTYLLNHEVVVRTDHQAITFLKQCKLSHGRLTRWTLALQEYNIRWEYVQGKRNIVADVLSRVRERENNMGKYTRRVLATFKDKAELEKILEHLPQQQKDEAKLNRIIRRLAESENDNVHNHYTMHNNLLFKRKSIQDTEWRLMIPTIIAEQLIKDYHDRYGHIGQKKTISTIKEHFCMEKLDKKVSKIIGSCDLCQKTKVTNIHYEGRWVNNQAQQPLEQVFIDICGPFPSSGRRRSRYLLIILDAFTKYTKLYTMAQANAATIIRNIRRSYLPEIDIQNV